MRARVLLFPATARRNEVKRLASRMSAMSPAMAQRHLVDHLRRKIERWRAIGVDQHSIERNLVALEAAVNAETWSLSVRRGDTA